MLFSGASSYFDSYVRKNDTNRTLNDAPSLLTDRGAYVNYLEVQLERISAALLGVQAYDQRFCDMQSLIVSLEQRCMSTTKLVALAQQCTEELKVSVEHKFNDVAEAMRQERMELQQNINNVANRTTALEATVAQLPIIVHRIDVLDKQFDEAERRTADTFAAYDARCTEMANQITALQQSHQEALQSIDKLFTASSKQEFEIEEVGRMTKNLIHATEANIREAMEESSENFSRQLHSLSSKITAEAERLQVDMVTRESGCMSALRLQNESLREEIRRSVISMRDQDEKLEEKILSDLNAETQRVQSILDERIDKLHSHLERQHAEFQEQLASNNTCIEQLDKSIDHLTAEQEDLYRVTFNMNQAIEKNTIRPGSGSYSPPSLQSFGSPRSRHEFEEDRPELNAARPGEMTYGRQSQDHATQYSQQAEHQTNAASYRQAAPPRIIAAYPQHPATSSHHTSAGRPVEQFYSRQAFDEQHELSSYPGSSAEYRNQSDSRSREHADRQQHSEQAAEHYGERDQALSLQSRQASQQPSDEDSYQQHRSEQQHNQQSSGHHIPVSTGRDQVTSLHSRQASPASQQPFNEKRMHSSQQGSSAEHPEPVSTQHVGQQHSEQAMEHHGGRYQALSLQARQASHASYQPSDEERIHSSQQGSSAEYHQHSEPVSERHVGQQYSSHHSSTSHKDDQTSLHLTQQRPSEGGTLGQSKQTAIHPDISTARSDLSHASSLPQRQPSISPTPRASGPSVHYLGGGYYASASGEVMTEQEVIRRRLPVDVHPDDTSHASAASQNQARSRVADAIGDSVEAYQSISAVSDIGGSVSSISPKSPQPDTAPRQFLKMKPPRHSDSGIASEQGTKLRVPYSTTLSSIDTMHTGEDDIAADDAFAEEEEERHSVHSSKSHRTSDHPVDHANRHSNDRKHLNVAIQTAISHQSSGISLQSKQSRHSSHPTEQQTVVAKHQEPKSFLEPENVEAFDRLLSSEDKSRRESAAEASPHDNRSISSEITWSAVKDFYAPDMSQLDRVIQESEDDLTLMTSSSSPFLMASRNPPWIPPRNVSPKTRLVGRLPSEERPGSASSGVKSQTSSSEDLLGLEERKSYESKEKFYAERRHFTQETHLVGARSQLKEEK